MVKYDRFLDFLCSLDRDGLIQFAEDAYIEIGEADSELEIRKKIIAKDKELVGELWHRRRQLLLQEEQVQVATTTVGAPKDDDGPGLEPALAKLNFPFCFQGEYDTNETSFELVDATDTSVHFRCSNGLGLYNLKQSEALKAYIHIVPVWFPYLGLLVPIAIMVVPFIIERFPSALQYVFLVFGAVLFLYISSTVNKRRKNGGGGTNLLSPWGYVFMMSIVS